jgi:hypothetical protein
MGGQVPEPVKIRRATEMAALEPLLAERCYRNLIGRELPEAKKKICTAVQNTAQRAGWPSTRLAQHGQDVRQARLGVVRGDDDQRCP